ncbi:MAG: hypothetical protein ACLPKI_04380 [Streptosporangiaceae bacterium]
MASPSGLALGVLAATQRRVSPDPEPASRLAVPVPGRRGGVAYWR